MTAPRIPIFRRLRPDDDSDPTIGGWAGATRAMNDRNAAAAAAAAAAATARAAAAAQGAGSPAPAATPPMYQPPVAPPISPANPLPGNIRPPSEGGNGTPGGVAPRNDPLPMPTPAPATPPPELLDHLAAILGGGGVVNTPPKQPITGKPKPKPSL